MDVARIMVMADSLLMSAAVASRHRSYHATALLDKPAVAPGERGGFHRPLPANTMECMATPNINILRIDSRRDDIVAAMAELRRRLSPEGNVVSEAGRQRTIEVFGEALRRAGRAADL